MRKFNNLGELQVIANTLDTAQERTILIKNPETTTPNKTERYKAIWNLQKDNLSCIATKRYKIIQHNESITQFVQVMNNLGLSVHGVVRDLGDKVIVEALFDNLSIEDGQKGIMLGVRLVNSYDMSHSFTGELFAYRLICTNGMVLGKALGVKFRRVHIGNIDVRKQLRVFIRQSADSSEQLKNLINISMKDSIEWKQAKLLMEELITRKKYRELIITKLKKLNQNELTRWDIYNVLTDIATHGDEITERLREWLQKQAQTVLTTPLAVLNSQNKKVQSN